VPNSTANSFFFLPTAKGLGVVFATVVLTQTRIEPMLKMSKKLGLICATATIICAMPYSIEVSKTDGIAVVSDQAQARIGRPLSPGSVAGVARPTTRRVVRRRVY
jgi:hypothetical protein